MHDLSDSNRAFVNQLSYKRQLSTTLASQRVTLETKLV